MKGQRKTKKIQAGFLNGVLSVTLEQVVRRTSFLLSTLKGVSLQVVLCAQSQQHPLPLFATFLLL